MTGGIAARVYAAFAPERDTRRWAEAVRPLADEALADPALRKRWLRCGGTWFAGVNVLPNDAAGAVPGRVPPLSGAALAAAQTAWPGVGLDRAQLSVCLPGYPRQGDGETEAAHRFRRDRDAAHLDGLHRDAQGRRFLGETHGFLLGIAVTDVSEETAPFVVWEGSHEVLRADLAARLSGGAPQRWPDEDLTEAYAASRRRIFDGCRRVALHGPRGTAWLVHRLALHGMAPWSGPHSGPRVIAWFRPDPRPGRDPGWWLGSP